MLRIGRLSLITLIVLVAACATQEAEVTREVEEPQAVVVTVEVTREVPITVEVVSEIEGTVEAAVAQTAAAWPTPTPIPPPTSTPRSETRAAPESAQTPDHSDTVSGVPDLPRLGDVVEADGYSLSAVSVEDPAKPDTDFYKPKKGTRLIGVEIIVGSTGAEVVSVNSYSSALIDAEGFSHEIEWAALKDHDVLAARDIGPGEKIKGWVGFEVAKGVSPAYLKYEFFRSGHTVLQVGLTHGEETMALAPTGTESAVASATTPEAVATQEPTETPTPTDTPTPTGTPTPTTTDTQTPTVHPATVKDKIEDPLGKMAIEKDELKGITWYTHKSIPDTRRKDWLGMYIGEDEDELWLRLEIDYTDEIFLDIEQYLVKADDKLFTIDVESGDMQSDHYGSAFWEWYDVLLTANTLAMIEAVVESDTAVLRYVGDKYYSERQISDVEKDALLVTLAAFEELGGSLNDPSGSAPKATDTPELAGTPKPTPTVETIDSFRRSANKDIYYKMVEKSDKYWGEPVCWRGNVFNIDESEGETYFQAYYFAGKRYDWRKHNDAFMVFYDGELPDVFEDVSVEVCGYIEDKHEGTNAYGATISQPTIYAEFVRKLKK